MRSSLIGLMLLSLVVCASAQSVPILGWGGENAEEVPVASWFGSTGLIYTPSATIAPPLRVSGGVHRVEFDEDSQDVYNANVALTQTLEVGLARIGNVAPPVGAALLVFTDETIANAKYHLDLGAWLGAAAVLGSPPDIAVGGWDMADKINRTLYVVASQELGIPDPTGTLSDLTVHVGWAQAERDTKNDDLKLGGIDGLFGGVEFSPFSSALVQVEYDSEDWNGTLRYSPLAWLSLDVGIVDSELAWGASARTAF